MKLRVHPRTPLHPHGFTLAELAIVLLIVGFLLGGMLLPISKQLETRNATEVIKQLEEVKEALTGFTLANGRLPCPADPAIASGTTGAGIERTPPCATGTLMQGIVPWATLGLRETDPWGRRLSYRVTADYADAVGAATYAGCTPSPTPTSASYGLCSVGDMTVTTKVSATATATTIAGSVVAVIISHGKNGYGGYLTSGTPMSDPPASHVDETTNKPTGSPTFIAREGSEASDNCSDTVAGSQFCEFDDVVIWIPYTTLLSKTVAAGKLP
jgi:prepilin-type N-terminal cleavage/methylation domain-containing protein